MLARRLERRMGLSHFENVAEYLAHLREHPEEVKQLARDLLISVTSFFRDPGRLHALWRRKSSPRSSGRRVPPPPCASGSPAAPPARRLTPSPCCCSNSRRRRRIRCRLQIFATDVDEQALEVARQGIYPEGISADVSPERLARFFTRVDESAWQISKQVRETVTFAVQNLIADAPFSKMDLISCRNLLIYLEPEVQKKIIDPLALRSQRGRLPVPGPVGDGWPANRPVRAGFQEMAHLPAHWPESGGRLAVPGDAGGAIASQAAAGQPAPGSSPGWRSWRRTPCCAGLVWPAL